jgi:hypothetical protein
MKAEGRVAKALTSVLLILGAAGFSAGQPSPKPTVRDPVAFTRKGSRWEASFAPALQRTLQRHFPGYAVLPVAQIDPEALEFFEEYAEQGPALPSLCTGDFDGNGLTDVAMLLHRDRRRWVIAAFHQTYQGGFRVYRLEQWSRARMYRDWGRERGKLRIFLATAPKGEEIEGKRGNHPAIEALDPSETSSMFFYYYKGRYYKGYHGAFRHGGH